MLHIWSGRARGRGEVSPLWPDARTAKWTGRWSCPFRAIILTIVTHRVNCSLSILSHSLSLSLVLCFSACFNQLHVDDNRNSLRIRPKFTQFTSRHSKLIKLAFEASLPSLSLSVCISLLLSFWHACCGNSAVTVAWNAVEIVFMARMIIAYFVLVSPWGIWDIWWNYCLQF